MMVGSWVRRCARQEYGERSVKEERVEASGGPIRRGQPGIADRCTDEYSLLGGIFLTESRMIVTLLNPLTFLDIWKVPKSNSTVID
jgi:hypothetical protein